MHFVDKHISQTRASRSFSKIIAEVRYGGRAFVVERRGEPVCRIAPIEPVKCSGKDLVRALRSVEAPDRSFFDTLRRNLKKQPRAPRSPWRS